MSVSKDQVVAWCTKLVDSAKGFPALEECLEKIPTLESLADLPAGTRVLVRGDVDVVVDAEGNVEEDVRLKSLLDTLKYGHEKGWVQLVYGHRGRDPKNSLEPVARCLHQLLQEAGVSVASVDSVPEWLDDATGKVLDSAAEQVAKLPNGSIAILENTRRYSLEQSLWEADAAGIEPLADRLTNYANTVREKLAKVHVNEGFAASNIDLSSNLVPLAMDRCALGEYIYGELAQYVTRTRQAELVIFSGMKINKLDDLEQILERGKVRMVIAAGALAIGLKKAAADAAGEEFELGLNGDPTQKKIYIPPERIEQSARILAQGRAIGAEFVLPVDFVLQDGSVSDVIPVGQAQFDIGPKSSDLQAQKVSQFIDYSKKKEAAGAGAGVAFHNGVFGKFEEEKFSHGTRKFMDQLKRMHEQGVEVYVGGGEGGLALMRYGDESWVTHCFTAGGTILKALGNEPIPYLKALYLKATGT